MELQLSANIAKLIERLTRLIVVTTRLREVRVVALLFESQQQCSERRTRFRRARSARLRMPVDQSPF